VRTTPTYYEVHSIPNNSPYFGPLTAAFLVISHGKVIIYRISIILSES